MQRQRGFEGMLEMDAAAAILHDMVEEATTLLELTAARGEDGSQLLRAGDDIYFSRRDSFEQIGSHLYYDKEASGQYRCFASASRLHDHTRTFAENNIWGRWCALHETGPHSRRRCHDHERTPQRRLCLGLLRLPPRRLPLSP